MIEKWLLNHMDKWIDRYFGDTDEGMDAMVAMVYYLNSIDEEDSEYILNNWTYPEILKMTEA